jgi:hypothetical protein
MAGVIHIKDVHQCCGVPSHWESFWLKTMNTTLGRETPAFRFDSRRNRNFLPLWILSELGLRYGRQFAGTSVDPPAIRRTTRQNIGKIEIAECHDRFRCCFRCRQALPRNADNEEIVSNFILQSNAGDRRSHPPLNESRLSQCSAFYKLFTIPAAQISPFQDIFGQ